MAAPASNTKPAFSIVICTYNRAELLSYCLNALAEAQASPLQWELIVVDNNSPDETSDVIKNFLSENSDTLSGRYVLETKQGLSHARNRGYQEAASDWVMYLDDDAKVKDNFLTRIQFLLEQTDYQIIGGVYYPWYHYGKPTWFKDAYGSNAKPIPKLSAPGGDVFACGGVMLWDKALLSDLGGFDPKVGMIGNKIAYGEETFLQMQAQKRGVLIAYDPELIIYHVVAEQKLNIDWFFKAYYARGRDIAISGQASSTFSSALTQVLIGLLVMFKDLIVHTPKLLSKDYYLENWLIDVFKKLAKRVGTAYTILKNLGKGRSRSEI